MDKILNQCLLAILLAILIIVPLFFDVRLYSVFDLSKITAFYLLVFALIVVFCVKRIINRGSSFMYNPLLLPIACYLAVACVATCFAIDPLTSVLGGYKRYNGLLSIVCYMFMFFIITNYVEYKMIDLFLSVIIITVCLTCGYGICQNYGIDCFTWNSDMGKRIFSTIGHPAFFSAYLIMILPLVYYRVIKAQKLSMLCLYLLCAVLILTTFYLTKTRASFIGLVVSNIFFFALLGRTIFKWNRLKIIILLLVVVGISVFCSLKDQTVFKRFSDDINLSSETQKLGGTMFARYYNILTAIEVVKDYPVTGIGFGNYGFVFMPYVSKVYLAKKETRPLTENQDRVHQDFMDVLVATGIMGLLVYLYAIWAYTRMMYVHLMNNRLLVVALSSGVLAYFIQNQFSFAHTVLPVMLFFLLGLSVVVCRTNTLTQGFIR